MLSSPVKTEIMKYLYDNLTSIELHLYIFIFEKIYEFVFTLPPTGDSQILVYLVSMNSVSDPFAIHKCLCNCSDNHLETVLEKQNRLDDKKLQSPPVIPPS